MTIEIRFPHQDEVDETIWYFQLIGQHSSDNTIRIARVEQALAIDEDPDDWLAANLAAAQLLVDAGEIDEVIAGRWDFRDLKAKAANELDWLDTTIPLIDSMNGAQVRDVVKRLAQENRQIIRAFKHLFNKISDL